MKENCTLCFISCCVIIIIIILCLIFCHNWVSECRLHGVKLWSASFSVRIIKDIQYVHMMYTFKLCMLPYIIILENEYLLHLGSGSMARYIGFCTWPRTNKYICANYTIIILFPFSMIEVWFLTFKKQTDSKNMPHHMGLTEAGGRLNKKDGLTRYGDSHVKDKTS